MAQRTPCKRNGQATLDASGEKSAERNGVEIPRSGKGCRHVIVYKATGSPSMWASGVRGAKDNKATIAFLLYVLRTTYSMSEGRRKTGRQGTPSQHASETERTICHSLSSCCGMCCWFVGLFVTFDSGHILPVEYLASQPCWRRLSRTWAVHWPEGTKAQHVTSCTVSLCKRIT